MIQAHKPHFRFPAWLEARAAEDDANQDRLRDGLTRAKASPEEARLVRARVLEQVALCGLESLPKRGAKVERRKLKAELAYALSMQGRYVEAAYIMPDLQTKKRFRDIQKAIARDDDEHCDCACERVEIDGRSLEIPNENVVEEIYSEKHGEMVYLTRCISCGDVFARPLAGSASLRLALWRNAGRAKAAPPRHDTEILQQKIT